MTFTYNHQYVINTRYYKVCCCTVITDAFRGCLGIQRFIFLPLKGSGYWWHEWRAPFSSPILHCSMSKQRWCCWWSQIQVRRLHCLATCRHLKRSKTRPTTVPCLFWNGLAFPVKPETPRQVVVTWCEAWLEFLSDLPPAAWTDVAAGAGSI